MKKIISIFLLGILIFSGCNSTDEKEDAYGNFESTEIIVSSQAMGEILQFNLEEGDILPFGTIVGFVDSTDLVLTRKLLLQQKRTIASQLESVNSEIAVQRQQLENNMINQKRTQNLFSNGAATQKQVDDINGLVELNQKQIAAVQSKKQSILDQMTGIDVQVEQIQEKISKCTITNPVDGTVLVKFAELGELATVGKPLYKIADLRKMILKAYVSGAQLPSIKIGQEVEVLFDKNDKEDHILTGTISWISSTAEFTPKIIQTKDERVNLVYAVKVAVDNDGSIKIGMPGAFNIK